MSEHITATSEQVVEMNGVLGVLTFTAELEVTRGPLGRFIDLADQIRGEGLEVPPEIEAVLADLQQPPKEHP